MERDLLLIRDNTFLARQIRRITDSNYEHIAIFIEDDKIIEATWSGVVISDPKKYINKTDLHLIANDAADNFINLLIKDVENENN